MDITKIINFCELSNLHSIIDYNNGVLTHNGKKYDVCAVVLGEKLTPKKIDELLKYKNVVKIGECHYKYAPEINYSVVYIKI